MRYFIEVSYKGTEYAGFQVQQNANSVQAEVEKAFSIVLKQQVSLTGSSRTDTGVHALQNFLHVDLDTEFSSRYIYNINALLPHDIVLKQIYKVADEAHSRFDALSREYKYYIVNQKDPFKTETAWFYPYQLNIDLLNSAAQILFNHTDYTSFSKRNTQVKTMQCNIMHSNWEKRDDQLIYTVKANRFLRGMVRGLVGTMLQVGRGNSTLADFENIILAKDCTKANFATPPHGLFLVKVEYPEGVLKPLH